MMPRRTTAAAMCLWRAMSRAWRIAYGSVPRRGNVFFLAVIGKRVLRFFAKNRRNRLPMTARKNTLPRRGTEPYAILHARDIARQRHIAAAVVRRGIIYGAPLNGAELVTTCST